MGDRTYMAATIHDCPPERAGEVLNALAEFMAVDNEPALKLGEEYDVDETYCGNSEELASALADIEGIAFEVYEDPKYEWLGAVHLHTPELGSWSAQCETNGGAVFAASDIWEWVTSDLSPEQIAERLGKPWRDALEAIQPEQTVLPRPTDEEDADV